MSSQNLVIFDIDGCLIDNTHRLHHLDKGDWDSYNSAWTADRPIPQGIVICRSFLNSSNYRVVFNTARSEKQRGSTRQQLQQFVHPKITDQMLLMRPANTADPAYAAELGLMVVPDDELKVQLLFGAGYTLDEVFLVYEDRQCIVDAWRALGIVCIQPAAGDF